MNYLLVKTNDGWQQVDIDEDSIAITIQANDVAELKSREASRSNRIKLPRTNKNLYIFDMANYPNTQTVLPYRYYDCLLYDNGVEIFGSTAKLKLMQFNDLVIEVCIYASVFDLFATLKELDIQALNIDGPQNWPLGWTLVTVGEWLETRDYIVFPLIDWASEENPSAFTEWTNESGRTYLNIKANYIFPALKFSYLLDKICETQGYTLSLPDEVRYSDKFAKAFVPFGNIIPTEQSKEWLRQGTAYNNNSVRLYHTAGPGQWYDIWVPVPNVTGNFTTGGDNNVAPRFTAQAKGRYTFKITINCELRDTTYLQVNGTGNTTNTTYGFNIDRGTIGVIERYLVFDLEKDEYCLFRCIGKRISTYQESFVHSLRYECVDAEIGGNFFPSDLLIGPSLPSAKQLDVLLLLAQLFCLIVTVDEQNKIVRFNSYDDLIKNINSGNVKDWSDKLDISKDDNTEFKIGSYAQENIIQYDSDTKTIGNKTYDIESKGSILIDDLTLDLQKDLFTLLPKALEDVNIFGYEMAKIRVLTEGQLDTFEDTDLFLVYCETVNGSFRFYNPNNPVEYYVYNDYAVTGRFEPISMPNMISRYKTLQDHILHRARLMKLDFKLSPIDVKNFDHSIPVYLKKYSCCFYVNKISNYVKDKLTSVELIAIKDVS